MIPKPIYEVLPYLYVGSGVASILNLDVMSGQVSGALLLLAGLIVYKLRVDKRAHDAAHNGHSTDRDG